MNRIQASNRGAPSTQSTPRRSRQRKVSKVKGSGAPHRAARFDERQYMQLTDEDLRRIAALIKAEVAPLIAESEARITTLLTNRFEGKLDAVEARINDRTARAIEDSATKLLTAFHEWASPTDQKIRSHREALRALDLQIEEIASRVKKLEADSETRH